MSGKRKRKALSRRIRFEVFKRDSFTCQYCGRRPPEAVLEADHIIPVAEGGSDDLLNLVTACWDCNAGKGRRQLSDDAIVVTQMRQAAELNERRVQAEMLSEWHHELRQQQMQLVDMANTEWGHITGGFVWTDSLNGEVESWIRKFGFKETIEAMRLAADQYLRWDSNGNAELKSVDYAFKRVPNIAGARMHCKGAEHLLPLYQIRGRLIGKGICPDALKPACLNLLERGQMFGMSQPEMAEIVNYVDDWEEFESLMEGFCMARIRSVHPGLFTDEAFMELSEAAQIFFIGLLVEADDQGVFAWKPSTLRARIRPSKDGDVSLLLEELEGVNMVRRFEFEGRHYGAVRNFRRFQRPKKPNTVHPLPPAFRTYVGLESGSSEVEGAKEPAVPIRCGTSSEPVPNSGRRGRREDVIPPLTPPSETSGTVAASGGEDLYFRGSIIRLTAREWDAWQKRYPDVDLEIDIRSLDAMFEREAEDGRMTNNWRVRVNAILAKRQDKAAAERGRQLEREARQQAEGTGRIIPLSEQPRRVQEFIRAVQEGRDPGPDLTPEDLRRPDDDDGGGLSPPARPKNRGGTTG